MPGDDKTEQPTAKKLSDAFNKGQFARSQELQTLCVTGAGFLSLLSFGPMIWDDMTGIMRHFFGGFNSIDIRPDFMKQYAATSISSVMKMVAPIVGAAALGGIAAGISQTRFKLTLGAGELDLNKLNPANGWKKLPTVHEYSQPTQYLLQQNWGPRSGHVFRGTKGHSIAHLHLIHEHWGFDRFHHPSHDEHALQVHDHHGVFRDH